MDHGSIALCKRFGNGIDGKRVRCGNRLAQQDQYPAQTHAPEQDEDTQDFQRRGRTSEQKVKDSGKEQQKKRHAQSTGQRRIPFGKNQLCLHIFAVAGT